MDVNEIIYIARICTLLLASIGFVCNVLNILAIVFAKLHVRTTYILVISLSISDGLIDLGWIFTSIHVFLRHLTLNQYYSFAAFSQTVYILGCMTCAWTLVLISVDLFLLTVLPLKYTFLQKLCLVLLLLTWIISFIIGPGMKTLLGVLNSEEHESFLVSYVFCCKFLYWAQICVSVVCFFLLIFLNIMIYRAIRGLRARSKHQRINLKKSAVVLCLVVTTYFVLYVPHWLTTTLNVYWNITNTTVLYLDLMLQLFHILNTIADPFIYAFRIGAIRGMYMQALKTLKCS